MAMVVGAQQAVHYPPGFQVGSSVFTDSTPRPSTCPIARPLAISGGLVSSRQQFSCSRVGAIIKSSGSSSRERRQLGGRRGSLLGCRARVGGGGGALTPELKSALDNFIQSNKVVLFMKGNRDFPQCGFSNTCIQILNECKVPYETINILEDDSLRQGVKEYSSWPTYPQLYIDGEFYGGCDITIDAFQNGELQDALAKALVS